MEGEWRYRGRTITAGEMGFVRELVAAHPQASRYELSRRLCEAWHWKQANGAPRDMVCRGLLLMLDRAGAIELPAVRRRPFLRAIQAHLPVFRVRSDLLAVILSAAAALATGIAAHRLPG